TISRGEALQSTRGALLYANNFEGHLSYYPEDNVLELRNLAHLVFDGRHHPFSIGLLSLFN
ncbi:hypothetical protein U1Q18_037290, partial [Sarracenia purpurea var. burkii]